MMITLNELSSQTSPLEGQRGPRRSLSCVQRTRCRSWSSVIHAPLLRVPYLLDCVQLAVACVLAIAARTQG